MNPSPYPAPFISAHVQAQIVKILLAAGAVITGMSLLAEAFSLATPPITEGQEFGDNPIGAMVVLIVSLLALLGLLIYVTTVVFFCIWLYRAYSNLRAFRHPGTLEYSPGWAVGSFFIPFANLVIPYRAVKELWQKSGPREEALLYEPGTPALFPIWWTFWLLASFAGRISMRVSFDEKVPTSTATMISMVVSVLSIVAAICAYMVVDAIDKRQEETSGKANLRRFSGPPPPPTNLGDMAWPYIDRNSS